MQILANGKTVRSYSDKEAARLKKWGLDKSVLAFIRNLENAGYKVEVKG